jgi:hypothetical protein
MPGKDGATSWSFPTVRIAIVLKSIAIILRHVRCPTATDEISVDNLDRTADADPALPVISSLNPKPIRRGR